jgi:hypothetical protein
MWYKPDIFGDDTDISKMVEPLIAELFRRPKEKCDETSSASRQYKK